MHGFTGGGLKAQKVGGGVGERGFEIVHSTGSKKALNMLSLWLGAMPHRIAIVCTIACSGWCIVMGPAIASRASLVYG